MNELSVHPNVYATGRSKGLLAMLGTLWLREQPAGDGTMYIVSGFANYWFDSELTWQTARLSVVASARAT